MTNVPEWGSAEYRALVADREMLTDELLSGTISPKERRRLRVIREILDAVQERRARRVARAVMPSDQIFDPKVFAARIKAVLERRRLSLRQAADEIGVQYNTVHRCTQERVPSVEAYLRIVLWLHRHEKQP
jgi:hypothetical protein